MDNQHRNEQIMQEEEQQQLQQQQLLPWQWRFPQYRLVELAPQQKQQLQNLWRTELQEVVQMTDFKSHQLPLARIKKVMKSDEEVKMISSDAPILLAKACEMLIHDLSLRAWLNVEENNRRTIQRSDISDAIWRTDVYDFLIDIVPRDSNQEANDNLVRANHSAITGNYVGVPAFNIANGNYASAPPHCYPFMGPIANTGNNSTVLADGRVGAIGGSSSRDGSNGSDLFARGLYYPPVGMMDPRFVGPGWPHAFDNESSSQGLPGPRNDVD